jgi:hypothetical protein
MEAQQLVHLSTLPQTRHQLAVCYLPWERLTTDNSSPLIVDGSIVARPVNSNYGMVANYPDEWIQVENGHQGLEHVGYYRLERIEQVHER